MGETEMSATIIAFRKPGAAVPAAENPQERLTRALAALEDALAQQRSAIAEWRQSMGVLRGSVQGLGQSLGSYRAKLGQLALQVDGVNRQARHLEAWADGVLAAEHA
jgi:hypothetical protein